MAGCLGGPVTGRERGIFEMLKTTANSQLTYYVVMYTVDNVNDKRLYTQRDSENDTGRTLSVNGCRLF